MMLMMNGYQKDMDLNHYNVILFSWTNCLGKSGFFVDKMSY